MNVTLKMAHDVPVWVAGKLCDITLTAFNTDAVTSRALAVQISQNSSIQTGRCVIKTNGSAVTKQSYRMSPGDQLFAWCEDADNVLNLNINVVEVSSV